MMSGTYCVFSKQLHNCTAVLCVVYSRRMIVLLPGDEPVNMQVTFTSERP